MGTDTHRIGSKADSAAVGPYTFKMPSMKYAVLVTVCSLVMGVYAYMAQSGMLEVQSPNAADSYYNLLVQGFRAGQLSLKREVPAGLAQLSDPYDPAANILYRHLDLSYYKGKFYLYFGVTPVLILFWPYVALTGDYLFHRQAVAIFCVIGFLASVGLLHALWRRYFAEVSVGVVAACALALGLATGVPVLLSQCDVYEVAISCGYMLTMLALAAIWCALHEPERRGRWLAAASLAYGLAVGARPNLLFGAVILLVPVVQAWRERRQLWVPLMAATVPITFVGLGLMLYNDLRFDSPFEFGWRYMMTWERQVARQPFRLQYLWFNFRAYFLRPARWSTRSPFVQAVAMPPSPAGYGQAARTFGVLTNVPLVWLALAVPLAWRNRPGQTGSTLRWFVTAVVLVFGICALTLGLFASVIDRYEVDFLPALLLLSVVGILGLEHALANRPAWRRAMRWGVGLLLGFSVAFNLFAGLENYAEAHRSRGVTLFRLGRLPEAVQEFEQALRIDPDLAEAHRGLGAALYRLGRLPEAIQQYKQAPQINPDYAEIHLNLGIVLMHADRLPEAIEHFEQALRIRPDFAEAHYNLGTALQRLGKNREAMGHYEQALRIQPGNAETQNALAWLLATLPSADGGDPLRAVTLARQACDLTHNHEPHYLDTLAAAYAAQGRFSDATETARKALALARADSQTQLVAEVQARLDLYRSGRPFQMSTSSKR